MRRGPDGDRWPLTGCPPFRDACRCPHLGVWLAVGRDFEVPDRVGVEETLPDSEVKCRAKSGPQMLQHEGDCGWPRPLVVCAMSSKPPRIRRMLRSARVILPRCGIRNCSTSRAYWALVVSLIFVRVDSQYRSHRSRVHPCAVRSSPVWLSQSLRAWVAAVLERKPPRRARVGVPDASVAEQAKYQVPWPRSGRRAQLASSRFFVSLCRQPYRL